MLQEQKVTYRYGQVSEAAMGMPAAQSFVSILQMTWRTWVLKNNLREGV